MSRTFRSADDVADRIVDAVGPHIVLGLPVGIGKSIPIANALFRRAARDPSLSLHIFSGLTLEVPQGSSELERRFVAPLAARLYTGWPTADYLAALRRNALPKNVTAKEFFLRPGAFLSDPLTQQSYASINYSHVVRELLALGVNVIAHLIASRPQSPDHYSLSSNPEITLDLLSASERAGQKIFLAAELHRALPYMLDDAELPRARFDAVLDDERSDYPLFPLLNRRVNDGDYATAMHVASLIADGGTLQIGIGSLSDAVAHCLLLRHRQPQVFAEVLRRLPGGSASPRRPALPLETKPFDRGLYASSELLSDALLALFSADIVRRQPLGDAAVQAGFFIGSRALYAALRELPEEARRRIVMTRISEVNTLHGDERRKREQRVNARFVNETMLVTLLGAAVSDALDDGRVVSGVGGQFDFVSMAHELDGARSILMFRARRERRGSVQSNVRWHYGHTTVPRHYRDIYVSEYGIADTRGRSDRDVIEQMLNVCDARFQSELTAAAIHAKKLPAHFKLPDDVRSNTPDAVTRVFEAEEIRAHFPPYPLGTEFEPQERQLIAALEWLERATSKPAQKTAVVFRAMLERPDAAHARALEHMRLATPQSLRERFYRRILSYALQQAKEH